MKLYHFTQAHKFFDTAGDHGWTADLKPSSNDDWRDMLGFIPEPMVWLTSEPNPKKAFVRPVHPLSLREQPQACSLAKRTPVPAGGVVAGV
jgi:hypothetical protein